jgi:hypothetical protein
LSSLTKKSSLPSWRQIGCRPPLLETCHRSRVAGNGLHKDLVLPRSFAFETGSPVRIESEQVRQRLERDVAVQSLVAGAIHLAHAARADELDNFVDTEPGASLQEHRID